MLYCKCSLSRGHLVITDNPSLSAFGARTTPERDFYFEDFVPEKRFVSPSFMATPAEIVAFAERYDPQYYHLDAVRARESIFEGLVCAGFQTASLSWGLALRTGLFDKCAVAGIGLDELRWLAPLREGDSVRASFWLVSGELSRSRPGLARATFQYEMLNQHDAVVMRLKMTQLLRCRPSAGR